METIEEEISYLKCELKQLLVKVGGEAVINELGRAFIEVHGKIPLKVIVFLLAGCCWKF